MKLELRETKLHNALKALHRVFIRTRSLAYQGENPHNLARLLDDAEYLVALLMHNGKDFEEFRTYLQGIGEKFPEFAGIVDDFDEANASANKLSKTA
jgi:hypothetical protein